MHMHNQNIGYYPSQPGYPYQGMQQPLAQPYPYNMHGFPGYGGMQGYPGAQMMPQGYHGYHQMAGNGSFPHSGAKQKDFLFHNPLQPDDGYLYEKFNNSGGVPNVYPKANMAKPPTGNSIMHSFKSQDGSLDINKMVNTAGQMMNALTQVSNMAKGITGIFK